MKLEERLNLALQTRSLLKASDPPPQKQIKQPEPATRIFTTLHEALKRKKHDRDEFGVATAIVRKINLEQIRLPMKVGRHTVEDIQRMQSGLYEVHFTESQENR
jgi:hypothetical protein